MQKGSKLERQFHHQRQSRRAMILLLLIGTTITISSVAIASYLIVRNIMLDNLKQRALVEVEQGGNEIDLWLTSRRAEVATLASSPTVSTMDWALAGPYLKAEVGRLAEYNHFTYAAADGTYHTTRVDFAQGKTVIDRPWMQQSLMGEVVVSDPTISRTTGVEQIIVSAPIGSPAAPKGVLGGAIGVRRVAQVVKQLNYGAGSYAFALNSEGRGIVHPDPSLQGTQEKPAPALTESTDSNLAAIARRMVARQRGIQLIQLEGIWYYVAYGPLEMANWSIALVIPRPNIERQLGALNLLAVILGILLVIALIEVWKQVHQSEQLRATLKVLQTTQAQLIQTEKMSSLGQLVAGVAHEINNPVNFIHGNLNHASEYMQGMLTLLHRYQQQYPDPGPEIEAIAAQVDLDFLVEDLPKVLSSMQVGADRIREIVASLRNFSRLDEAEMKQVDIHDGIDSTLMILQNRLKSRLHRSTIHIVKHYGDLPAVECYAGQLNQVFMNILNNAIDALEEVGTQADSNQEADASLKGDGFIPTITIQTELKQRTKQQIDAHYQSDLAVIRIRDNGPGIPSTVKAQMFDPFYTTKPTGKGTGLGLAISYQIIAEKHHGRLWCVSEPGQGAEFWIEIPIYQTPFPPNHS